MEDEAGGVELARIRSSRKKATKMFIPAARRDTESRVRDQGWIKGKGRGGGVSQQNLKTGADSNTRL